MDGLIRLKNKSTILKYVILNKLEQPLLWLFIILKSELKN